MAFQIGGTKTKETKAYMMLMTLKWAAQLTCLHVAGLQDNQPADMSVVTNML